MQRLVKKISNVAVRKCEHMKACQICRDASARSTWQLQELEYTTKLSEKILKLRSIFGRRQYYRKPHSVTCLRRTRPDQFIHRHVST